MCLFFCYQWLHRVAASNSLLFTMLQTLKQKRDAALGVGLGGGRGAAREEKQSSQPTLMCPHAHGTYNVCPKAFLSTFHSLDHLLTKHGVHSMAVYSVLESD